VIRVLVTALCMVVIVVVVAAAVLVDLIIKVLPLIVVGLIARAVWRRRYRPFGLPPAPAMHPGAGYPLAPHLPASALPVRTQAALPVHPPRVLNTAAASTATALSRGGDRG